MLIPVGPVAVEHDKIVSIIAKAIVAFIVVVVLVFILAAAAFNKGHEVEATCGPTVSTPLADRGLDASAKVGDTIHKVTTDFTSPWRVVSSVFGMFKTLRMWLGNVADHANRLPEGSTATGWRNATKDAQQKALAGCCVTANPPPNPSPTPPPTDPPFDPKQLAFQRSTRVYQPEQMDIARTAIAVGKSKGVPAQGWVVAIATGWQESQMRNIDYGHLDSVGWLQQRASWGTVSQRMNPSYAAGKFYDALVKVPGWQQMPVTRAAQAVQVSAYPNAYAQWEDEARDMVARLSSTAPAPPGASPPAAPVACETAAAAPQPPADGGPTTPGTTPKSSGRALEVAAWAQAHVGTYGWERLCLSFARQAAGAPGGQYDANAGWAATKFRHYDMNAPRGAIVWYAGGANGHVAVSAGDGMIYSNDVVKPGRIDKVRLDFPVTHWNHRYLGWTEDVNGVRISGLGVKGNTI